MEVMLSATLLITSFSSSMCALCHVGDIIVAARCTHGSISGQVDEHGHRLCRLCRERITRSRPGRTYQACGCIVHAACRLSEYKKRRNESTSSSSSSPSLDPSPRFIKIRAVLHNSRPIPVPPITNQDHLDLGDLMKKREGDIARKNRFLKYGYVRADATDASRELAWKMMSIDRGAPLSMGVDDISGNVRQYDLTTTSRVNKFRESIEEWNRIVKQLAESVDIDTKSLYVVDPKLLVAQPKEGLQPIHFDCARTSLSHNTFSAILYCSNGCLSTALPKFPANDLLSYSHIPSEMQSVAHLLERDQYESLPVQVGDMVLFRQSTPHFGVQNDCARDNRVVLFSILSPSPLENQDASQVFSWLYVGEAFSWKSIEFAQSLVENKQYQPISRIRDDVDKESSLACEKLLSLFDLLSKYNAK